MSRFKEFFGFLLSAILVFGFSNTSISQNCEIIFPTGTSEDYQFRSYRSISQSNSEDKNWSDLQNGIVSDNQYIGVDLAPTEFSELLRFSNFKFDIPEGSVIHGITVVLDGHSEGEQPLDFVVRLANNSNTNLANLSFTGTRWPLDSDGSWSYGASWFLWNGNWNTSRINASNFGVQIQLRNTSDTELSAFIDKLRVEVNYTPPYSVCSDHACIIASVSEDPSVSNYSWNIPNDFHVISQSSTENLIIIAPNDNVLGTYDLCVTPQNSGQCCTSFSLVDCSLGSIGDFVFDDRNDNGIQDANDLPMGGINIFLFDDKGNIVGTTVSDNNGFYQFANIESGTYYIQIAEFGEYLIAQSDVGNYALDSDLTEILGPGTTDLFFLNPGENKNDIDIGLRLFSTISGLAWLDNNGNGLNDASESPLENITVSLFDQNDQLVSSTNTDIDGSYLFEDLSPNLYYVVFENPQGFVFTTAGLDSDVDNSIVAGSTSLIDAIADNNIENVDAGIYQLVGIGDYVWLDLDRDGIQDSDENGIEGLEISLVNANGAIQQVQTDNNGIYQFSNLPPGQYSISIEKRNDLQITIINQGNGSNDSDALTDSGNSYDSSLITLNSGEIISDLDFGFQFKPSSISGFAWEDFNGDALNNNSEMQLASIPIGLFSENGQLIHEVLTDATGAYTFDNLNPGNYYIVFDKTGEYVFTMFGMDSDVNSNIVEGSTNLINLNAGTDVTGIDAGFYIFASIGDFIWLDLDRDGIQDNNEPGIADLDIKLLSTSGLIMNNTTDNDGNYNYDFLPPGQYIVSIHNDPELQPTLFNQGNGSNDSDEINDVGAYYNSMVITMFSGEERTDLDFGFQFIPAAISGFVWEDLNANGADNTAEPRVSDIQVTLFNAANVEIAQTTTSNNGNYSFPFVNPGEYYIVFDNPQGFQFTSAGIDSDVTGTVVSGSTDIFTIMAGSNLSSINAGIFQFGSIGDYVWIDDNRNGRQDTSEAGIPSLEVTLTDAAGNEITTQTDNNGAYLFDQLIAGEYFISLPSLSETDPTTSNNGNGSNDSRPLNDLGTFYTSNSILLNSGENISNQDFGFVFKPSSISGTAWEDLNFNGLDDAGETNRADLTVTLFESTIGLISTTQTNGLGNYQFNNLNPGMYYVIFDREDPFLFTTPGADSDVLGMIEPGATNFIVLMPDTQMAGIDAGYYRTITIGDYVWEDINLNGIQGGNESGLADVVVNLLDANGTQVDMSITNSDGLYQFVNVNPGTYQINIEIADSFNPTQANQGNGNNDSRILNSNLTTNPLNFVSGQNRNDLDFGFVMSVSSISGSTWFDLDADGIRENGEPINTGVTVSLFDESNTLINTVVTDMSGNYSFANLLDGDYYIVFETLTNIDFTNSMGDSDVTNSIVIGSTDMINLAMDEDIINIDAGYIAYSSLGDYVWFDANGNGIQNANESGIGGVLVSLFDENGEQLGQQLTDADGFYSFTNLLPADYFVVFDAGSTFIPSPDGQGNGANDSDITDIFGLGSTTIFSLGFMEDKTDIDGGFEEVFGSISGSVFTDLDANGLNQVLDTPLSGIEVELYSTTNGLINSTTTNGAGNYNFTQVNPDDYYVLFNIPSDLIVTNANQGSNDQIDSDITGINGVGTTDTFTLPIMGNVQNVDAGVYQFATLGDQVWVDENENGLNDMMEGGLVGVEVSLLNNNGSVLETQMTEADGMFLFTDLVPGIYQIRFEMPDNYEFTAANAGMDTTIDSDASNNTGNLGFTNQFPISSGQIDLDKDAGVILTGGGDISGAVWEDDNADGLRDNMETLLSGISVDVVNTMGTIIASTTTDMNGNYEFIGIAPQDVYLVFTPKTSQLFSPADIGMDDSIDSDATGTNGLGSTELITVMIDDQFENVDAGLYSNGTIGDFVWIDEDMDGIQDNGEPGYNGAIVELYDTNSQLIASTTTANINGEDGMYSFDNITPGTYIVSVGLMGDFVFTLTGAGNGSDDSDISQNGTGTSSTLSFMLTSGEINNDIDAGVFEQDENNLQGYAFEDVNGNGLKDFNDVNQNGIVVILYDTNGALIDTDTTADDINGIPGFYSFLDVPNGDYYIEFEFPTGAIVTLADVGMNEALDSDLTNANGDATTDNINLSMGGATTLICGGYYFGSTIGDYVWNDMISNGIQDPSENGVNNIIVRLFDDQNNQVAMTSTFNDNNGNGGFYQFNNVAPGTYYVRVNSGAGMTFTSANQGIDDDIDSDVSGVNGAGSTNTYLITSGSAIDNVDIGLLMQPASVGDFVWEDLDGDGVQDPMEGGIEGVQVELYNDAMAFVSSTVTDVTGSYLFDNIQPGLYYIVFTAPGDYIVTDADQGGNDTQDSDIMNVIQPGATNIFNLNAGENDMDIDGGFYLPADIGDFVWNDLNENGIQDPGEPGLEGVSVDLRFGTFIVLETVVTDENGFFTFDGLKQGVYSLRFYDIPAGFQFSPMDQGGDDTVDSDAGANGETSLISLAHGVDFMDLDAGLFDTSNITEDDQDDTLFSDEEEEDEEDSEETNEELDDENQEYEIEEEGIVINEFKITLWPMPASDYVSHAIHSNTDSPLQWTIVNSIGQPIKTFKEKDLVKGINHFTIDVSDLMPGTYFVKYQMYGFHRIKPLIIN